MARAGRSPRVSLLSSLRGEIVDARLAYPDVLHVEICGSAGEVSRLATQDANWSPTNPAELVGKEIVEAKIDAESGGLHCELSDGSALDVEPGAGQASDDPPSWELITSGGAVLEVGPGAHGRRLTGAPTGAPRVESC